MIEKRNKVFQRGDVVLVDFGNRQGSIEYGIRPAIVVGNQTSNLHSPAISVVPLTTSMAKINKMLPTHTLISPSNSQIRKTSVAMAEQVQVVDKSWIVKNEPLFKLSNEIMQQIDMSLVTQFFGMNIFKQQMAYMM